MYNPDTELLFPSRVIPSLLALRSEVWDDLVDRVLCPEIDESARLAFVLMMVRLDGCVSCNTHSFRAMRGCTQCAQQAIRRFRGTDEDLLLQYDQAKVEVLKWMEDRAEVELIL
jgi:hypothetical protein